MEKLRIGVLGVSGHLLTRIMLPLSQSKEVEIVALASREIDKAKAAAQKWNINKYYGSYDELLEDSWIEAVYIPLPNHLHLEWMKKSIDAGKHVLCEKPLTLNAGEVQELIDYAADKKLKVMEAFMYPFHPKWQAVKELMKVSGIGEVHTIHTIFSYQNQDAKNIRNIKDYGGGAIMDIGCYAIHSARWILGKEPEAVLAKASYSDAFGTDIISSGILDFGKARALFTVSTSTFPAQEVKVYGSGGSLEVVLPFNDAYDVASKVKVTTGLGERILEFPPTNQYERMFSAFAKSIREEEPLPFDLQSSYKNMQIIDGLFASVQTNGWVKIE